MEQNNLVAQYAQQIAKILLDSGISREEVAILLQELDEVIQTEISKDLVNALTQEEKDKLDAADENKLSMEEFGKLLGATPKDITDRYIQKLEIYTKALPQNLPQIKQQLLQKKS
jgi:Ca2+-binding EF-hand superfamily protein